MKAFRSFHRSGIYEICYGNAHCNSPGKVLKAPVNILDKISNIIPRKKSSKTFNFKPRYQNHGYRIDYAAPTSPSYYYKPVAVKTAAPVAKPSMKSNFYPAPSPVVANVNSKKPISILIEYDEDGQRLVMIFKSRS